MKFAMLEIVADTLSMDFDQKAYFGDALFDIIVMLMSKKDQKISKDLFVKVKLFYSENARIFGSSMEKR